MLIQNDLNIIFDEGPIARAYITLIEQEKIELKKKIILLNNDYFKNFFFRKKFLIRNHFALKYLADKKVFSLINQIEKFLKFDLGFCEKMYNFNNSYYDDKTIQIKSDNINSLQLSNLLKNIDEKLIFLNTTKQILKEPLKTNHKFIHIHPGYLPYLKGMDCSLWGISKRNKLGVSSFFINNEIDCGEIIDREELEAPKFFFENQKDYNNYDKYCIWFSFFDPLLRAAHLKKILKLKIENINHLKITKEQFEKSQYFKKMDEKKLDYVFKKIFY
jgi:hypothetical protein